MEEDEEEDEEEESVVTELIVSWDTTEGPLEDEDEDRVGEWKVREPMVVFMATASLDPSTRTCAVADIQWKTNYYSYHHYYYY